MDRIGSALALSLDQGLSADETADAIDYIIDDPARSMVIARTETSRALVDSNLTEYRDAGIESVQWLVADPCDICEQNADMIMPMGEEFPSGDVQPPAHPNCVCDLAPVSRFDYDPDTIQVDEEDIELADKATLNKYDPDQPRDESGRFGSGGEDSVDAIVASRADIINTKTEALRKQGATTLRVEDGSEEMKQAGQSLEQIGMKLIEANPEDWSPEDLQEMIMSEMGLNMTYQALNTAYAGDQDYMRFGVFSDGQLAGATSMTLDASTAQPMVTLDYLGTTGIVDGAGSTLFGEAITFANKNDADIRLIPADEDAKNFWLNMGFQEADLTSRFAGYLFMPKDNVEIIAGSLK